MPREGSVKGDGMRCAQGTEPLSSTAQELHLNRCWAVSSSSREVAMAPGSSRSIGAR